MKKIYTCHTQQYIPFFMKYLETYLESIENVELYVRDGCDPHFFLNGNILMQIKKKTQNKQLHH